MFAGNVAVTWQGVRQRGWHSEIPMPIIAVWPSHQSLKSLLSLCRKSSSVCIFACRILRPRFLNFRVISKKHEVATVHSVKHLCFHSSRRAVQVCRRDGLPCLAQSDVTPHAKELNSK